jgi:hypothetical protein
VAKTKFPHLPRPNLAVEDNYGDGGAKISATGVSTTSKRLRQLSASSPTTMEASDSARVVKARATCVEGVNDCGGEVFIRRSSVR